MTYFEVTSPRLTGNKGGIRMLKEIKKRHQEDKLMDWVQPRAEQAHQDRAYLLELVEEIQTAALRIKLDAEYSDCVFGVVIKSKTDWEEFLRVLKKLEDRGMRPCPKWNSNKGICNLDSKTCMISQYDWQNCPKGEEKGMSEKRNCSNCRIADELDGSLLLCGNYDETKQGCKDFDKWEPDYETLAMENQQLKFLLNWYGLDLAMLNSPEIEKQYKEFLKAFNIETSQPRPER